MRDPRLDASIEWPIWPVDNYEKVVETLSEEQRHKLFLWAGKFMTAIEAKEIVSSQELSKELLPSHFLELGAMPHDFQDLDRALLNPEQKGLELAVELLFSQLTLLALEKKQGITDLWMLYENCHQAPFLTIKRELQKQFPNHEEQIIATLKTHADFLNSTPTGLRPFSIDKNRFLATLQQWRQEESISSVWSYDVHFSHYPIFCPTAALFAHILNLHATTGCELLERVSIPPFIELVLLHSSVLHNKKLLLSVVAKAPSTLSANSESEWNRNILAPIALQALIVFIKRIADTLGRKDYFSNDNKELIEFQKMEAQHFFEEASEVILKRKDGRFLACHFATWLANRTLQRTEEIWSPHFAFFTALFEKMHDQGIDFNVYKSVLEWELPTAEELDNTRNVGSATIMDRVPSINAYMAMLHTAYPNEKIKKENPDHLEAFEALLISTNNDIFVSHGQKTTGPHYMHRLLALPYVNSEVPSARWQQTWETLAGVRLRYRHSPVGHIDNAHKEANRLLPIVGLAIFDELYQCKHNDLDKHWKNLWEAVFNHWLVEGAVEDSLWGDLIHLVILRHNLLFATVEQNPIHYANSLKPFLLKLSNANRILSVVACNLVTNIPRESIKELLPIFVPAIESLLGEEKDIREELRHVSLVEACQKFLTEYS